MMRADRFTLTLLLLSLLLAAGCASGRGADRFVPKEVQARMDLAVSYLSKDKPRHSLNELQAIAERGDGIAQYHFLLGLTYMGLEKHPRAIEQFKRAVDLKPDYGQAWNNLGNAYVLADRQSKAEDAFRQALGIDTYMTPEFPAYNLARMHRNRGQTREAVDFAKQAIKQNWRYTPAYMLLSDIFLESNRIRQATKWLEKGVDANPDNVRLILRLAENQMRLGENENASYWFHRIVELQPDSKAAKVARDYLDVLQE
jgi:Tfp pilus assembly protein PilF